MPGLNQLMQAAIEGGKPGEDNPDAPSAIAANAPRDGTNLIFEALSVKTDPIRNNREKNAERRRLARDGR